MAARIISRIIAPVLMLNVVSIETRTLTDAQQRDGLITRINGAPACAEVRGTGDRAGCGAPAD